MKDESGKWESANTIADPAVRQATGCRILRDGFCKKTRAGQENQDYAERIAGNKKGMAEEPEIVVFLRIKERIRFPD